MIILYVVSCAIVACNFWMQRATIIAASISKCWNASNYCSVLHAKNNCAIILAPAGILRLYRLFHAIVAHKITTLNRSFGLVVCY